MRFQLTLARILTYLFIAFIALASCKKDLEDERTFNENSIIEEFIALNNWAYTVTNGVYRVVRTPSYSYKPALGDTLEFWYSGYTLDGKVFDTNDKIVAKTAKLDTLIRSFDPVKVFAGQNNLIDGLNIGLFQIRNGETATIIFPSALGFGNDAFGSVEAWSPLAFNIKLIKVNSLKIQEEKSYISSLNLSDFKDTLGLYIKKEIPGVGLNPTLTDTIFGWYKGTLFDGTVFDEVTDGNQKFVLASDDMPEGLRIGFLLTKELGTAKLVLPSYMGYGNNGEGLVKPYKTLHYSIRIDSIK